MLEAQTPFYLPQAPMALMKNILLKKKGEKKKSILKIILGSKDKVLVKQKCNNSFIYLFLKNKVLQVAWSSTIMRVNIHSWFCPLSVQYLSEPSIHGMVSLVSHVSVAISHVILGKLPDLSEFVFQ